LLIKWIISKFKNKQPNPNLSGSAILYNVAILRLLFMQCRGVKRKHSDIEIAGDLC